MAGVNNNLKPLTKDELTSEKQRERGKKGGVRSQQVQHEKKTLSQIFTMWANGKPKAKDIELLKSLGLDVEDVTNKSLLIVPIIQNIQDGDTKTLQMAIDLLGEDKRKQKEIEKLTAETERLRMEIKRLENELNGDVSTNKIIIVNDIPKAE